MSTKEMTREQISALADGELPDSQMDVVFAALRRDEGRGEWDIYHQIGDVLRSDDMVVNMSPGFAARMSARLDAEPTIVAPITAATRESTDESTQDVPVRVNRVRRWVLPSMASAAAMATVAFFTTPQLMVAMKSEDAPVDATVTIAFGNELSSVVAASAPEGVVLRDPRIDDYLMAHQRFSPSVYSTAHFVRSATFASDSNK